MFYSSLFVGSWAAAGRRKYRAGCVLIGILLGSIGTIIPAPVNAARVSGVICTGNSFPPPDLVYSWDGVKTSIVSAGGAVNCTIPVDENVGSTASFSVAVEDTHNDSSVLCQGHVYDGTSGALVAFTPNVDSGAAFIGQKTLSVSAVVPTGGTYTYRVKCGLPAGDRVRVLSVF